MTAAELIKRFEGFSAIAYPDPGTGGEPWTIGYGTTVYPNGQAVRKGDTCSKEQASEWLAHDIEKFYTCVRESVKLELTQAQIDALVSFTYNVGCSAFKRSTLLKLINQSRWSAAGEEFLKWNKAGGKVLPGLTKRRKAERALFLSNLPDKPFEWLPIEKEKPMAPFIAAALPLLIEAAPELIRVFGNGEQSEKNAKAAEKVVEIAKSVTGATTAEEAVTKITQDQSVADSFRQEAAANFLDIERLADQRVAAARDFNSAEKPIFGAIKFVHILSALVVLAALLAIGYVLGTSEDATERSMALQTLLLTGFGGVLMYWLGSSDGSAKKTDMLRSKN